MAHLARRRPALPRHAQRPRHLQNPALEKPVTVTGDVTAVLRASTTGTDADWIVKLLDVSPDGTETMIVDEIFRGRYRKSFEHPEPIPANQIEDYKYSLHGADHTFLPGHRIMVSRPVLLVPPLRPQPPNLRRKHHVRPRRFLQKSHDQNLRRQPPRIPDPHQLTHYRAIDRDRAARLFVIPEGDLQAHSVRSSTMLNRTADPFGMTKISAEIQLNPMIKTISTREVYRNPWTSVREDIIERANGVRGLYGVIDKDPASLIIPLDGDHVYLVEQYRYTVQRRAIEFPQGGWERANIIPEDLARGELKEETGLTAGRLTHLADLQIAYGVMNQRHHIFLAEDLTPGAPDPDAEETDLIVHRVPIREFEDMLLDGRVVDNCTAAAWGLYRTWRDRNPRLAAEQ